MKVLLTFRISISKPFLPLHRKGSDAGDHPPITPMKSASESELSGDSWRLYDYITRHFIATVSFFAVIIVELHYDYDYDKDG